MLRRELQLEPQFLWVVLLLLVVLHTQQLNHQREKMVLR